ncbi:ATP-dependent zinc metalloprotease FtsH [Fluoribacter dumoffii]|uniref:ATP-dependent zinc metalloprotease FtsH n=1 Tax=Fluoribacter dumoffii TaxID=463 RepID=A0A377G7F5_9GAMM|nr:ATP-dependent zinc metalloprotease FtsH [Fluoribacter dumoffii]KTC89572.1 protease, ATP-dependent zinc-metallo [Fluoribacter dumoffii NY 23]MCW8384766.1 ATP-dependent zinc metalloprotease FtsH [Fluoribacter dumoffii]MCW8417829.1 ATP-dependent zinc metalloprotease FtsH [Fluoribacter dumoffii]MCW8454329.1 ATP-dependent zinc metalloprotease FtsH [Fluoribacter dumoffii]MCW8461597.1 ATP-dependent zinc metalloprotease FtsH [Fluoribacter dumoffii]
MENKQWQFSLWYVLIFFWILILFQNFFFASHPVNIAYSDFIKLLKAHKIDNVLLEENYITANVKTEGLATFLPEDKLNEIKQYGGKEPQVTTVRINDPSLVPALEAAKVKFNGQIESKWLTMLLSWVIPALLFFALWSFLIRRMGSAAGGVLDVGKSKAKMYMEKETHVSFQDVAGVDEAKAELMEVVEFLKNPQHYTRIGAHIPKGVLLVGPPGTGKTLLARAVAGEAGVPFFSINGSEFVEMFVGVGAARVRDLFNHARETAPAIIFIDELDALGRARGAYPIGGGHDEKEQTLNQLLSEMDGFDPSEGLILLAATNRPEILDPALLRAGRFDRHVLVDRPDKKGRIEILNVHLRKIKQDADVDAEKIAALTPGFSGADLANLVNEAALLATRHDADSVSMDDFTNAVERIVAGLEKKNRLLNPEERKAVAYHEMGHTLIALSLPNVDQVHKVSIIPRGIGSLGYTIQRPTEDRYLMTEEELTNKMMVLLGGRAAEFVVFGRFSTGAADDLAKATDIARSMVMRYGMDKDLGPVTYQKEHSMFLEPTLPHNDREFSEETACEIDAAVRKIIQSAFDDAVDIIKKRIKILEKGATLLLQKETLNEEDLLSLNIKQ